MLAMKCLLIVNCYLLQENELTPEIRHKFVEDVRKGKKKNKRKEKKIIQMTWIGHGIKMSWKDILKELSPRERMDAEDFAPEEMGEWREEQANDANLHLLEKYAERFDRLEMYINSGDMPESMSDVLPLFLKRGRMFLKKREGENAERQWRSTIAIMRGQENHPFRR